MFFKPVEGEDSDLGIELKTGSRGRARDSIKYSSGYIFPSGYPSVEVLGLVEFLITAILCLAILGSGRNIRDYHGRL